MNNLTGKSGLGVWCVHGMTGLLMLLLIYGPLALGGVRATHFLVIQWVSLALLGLWLLRFWADPEARLYAPPILTVILVFVLYAAARYLTADLEYVARQEYGRILVYGAVFLVVIHLAQRPEIARTLALTLVVVAAGISLYAVYQFLTNSDQVWLLKRPAGYAKRGSGTYINPNHLAGFLEMVLPVGLAFTMVGRLRPVPRILLAYGTLIIAAGLLSTVSRGGWLSSAGGIGLLLFWVVRQRQRRWVGLGLAAILVLAGLVFVSKANFSPDREGRLNLVAHRADVRLLLWKPAWQMWLDHPWLGAGPGHFNHRFPQYRPAHHDIQARPDRVHNDYLNALVDWGVVGAGLLLLAGVLACRDLMRSTRWVGRGRPELMRGSDDMMALVMGAAAGLASAAAHALVDFNMHIPANALTAVTLGGLLTGFSRVANDRFWTRPGRLTRWLVSLSIITILGWHGGMAWRKSKEAYWLTKAEPRVTCSPVQLAALERAFAIEPNNYDTASRIGECYRLQMWDGSEDYLRLSALAMQWFDRCMRINPFEPYGPLRYGMCLDWIGQHEAAEPYYHRALGLDPNGYLVMALLGWHYLQRENYAEAKRWLERSLATLSSNNVTALYYLRLVNQRLAERASAEGDGVR